MAVLLGRHWHHTAWASLADSVRTGESAFLEVYGVPHFDWLHANAEERAIFNEAMTSLTAVAADAVTQAYDFSRIAKIVDVAAYGEAATVCLLADTINFRNKEYLPTSNSLPYLF